MINLVKVCRQLNTMEWDVMDDLPLYLRESTLAQIAAHVFEPEDIEEIVADIDTIDYEWFADHTDLDEHQTMAVYIANRVGQQVTRTNHSFILKNKSNGKA